MTDYREFVMDLVENDGFDITCMLIACLKYMSQDQVREMLELNDLFFEE